MGTADAGLFLTVAGLLLCLLDCWQARRFGPSASGWGAARAVATWAGFVGGAVLILTGLAFWAAPI